MTTYSTSLKLALIGDGQESGTWGQTTNTNLGTLLEQAITGYVAINMADANVTLTNLNGTADQARNAVIELTGTNAAVRDVIPPVVEKLYTIFNNTTGGYAIRVIGATGTGVNIPNGTTALVYCNGTNFISGLSGTSGSFAVNGALTTTGNGTIGGNLAVTGTTALTGASTAPTVSSSDNSTNIATTAYVKTNLGTLGTMSTQNANAVTITGGTINGAVIGGSNAVAVTGTTITATTQFSGPGTGLTGTAASLTAGTATTATTATNATNASNAASGSALASGTAKAWVSFNSSGTILKAYNVTSIGVRGTGQWTVNFTNALADGNYVMAGCAGYGPVYANSGGIFVSFNVGPGGSGTPPTTTACEVNTVRGTYTSGDAVYYDSPLTTLVFFD
jgi:hypothetical protein